MARTVPTGVPAELIAGDTWEWTTGFADFPVSEGWVLSYELNGPDAPAWTAGWTTTSGNAYNILVPIASTTIEPGRYEWSAVVTGAGAYTGKRYIADRGVLVVLPNPATQNAGDRVPFAETQLTLVEAHIAGRIPQGMEEYQIAGRLVRLMPMAEALKLRQQLRQEVWRLRHPGEAYPSMRVAFPPTGKR